MAAIEPWRANRNNHQIKPTFATDSSSLVNLLKTSEKKDVALKVTLDSFFVLADIIFVKVINYCLTLLDAIFYTALELIQL